MSGSKLARWNALPLTNPALRSVTHDAPQACEVRVVRVLLSPDAWKVYGREEAVSMVMIVRIPDGARLFGIF